MNFLSLLHYYKNYFNFLAFLGNILLKNILNFLCPSTCIICHGLINKHNNNIDTYCNYDDSADVNFLKNDLINGNINACEHINNSHYDINTTASHNHNNNCNYDRKNSYSSNSHNASCYNICHTCNKELQLAKTQNYCFSCGVLIKNSNKACLHCEIYPPFFDDTKSLFIYNANAKIMISRFKFYDQTLYAKYFAQLIIEHLSTEILQSDFIIPIPLHRRRLFQRKYNQTILIANKIGKILNHPVENYLIKRIKYSKPQASLSGEARANNLKDVFALYSPSILNKLFRRGKNTITNNNNEINAISIYNDINIEKVKNKIKGARILLLDDVITTGNTINACAKLLKENGASSVIGLSVARTILNQH